MHTAGLEPAHALKISMECNAKARKPYLSDVRKYPAACVSYDCLRCRLAKTAGKARSRLRNLEFAHHVLCLLGFEEQIQGIGHEVCGFETTVTI